MPTSPTAYAIPLQLELKPSRPLAWTLLTAHLLALASLVPADIHWLLKLLICIPVVYSLQDTLRRHAWLSHPRALHRLVWKEKDWLLEYNNGDTARAQLEPSTTRLGKLLVLNFKAADVLTSCIVLPHRLDGQGYRRLRVRMKLYARTLNPLEGKH